MRFEVRPGDGVGILRFGMHRDEARKRLGQPEETQEWDDLSESQDFWLNDGLSGLYDADGVLVEIMVLPPAGAAVGSVSLLGLDPDAALAALRSLDPAAESGEHMVSRALGLVIEVEDDDDTGETVAAQLIAVEPARMARLLAEDVE